MNTLTPTQNGADCERAKRSPRYEVAETPDAFELAVHLPGVPRDGLEITDENGELWVRGTRPAGPSGAVTALVREISDADYELVLRHGSAVDAGRIAADLQDGVLRLKLPKPESSKPRKIPVA